MVTIPLSTRGARGLQTIQVQAAPVHAGFSSLWTHLYSYMTFKTDAVKSENHFWTRLQAIVKVPKTGKAVPACDAESSVQLH